MDGACHPVSPAYLCYGLKSWPSERSFIVYRRSKNGNPALGLSPPYKIFDTKIDSGEKYYL